MERPVLALVGHGTDASEGLEPGIHLRWAFRREVGFPDGGFCLFRRDARRPPMRCFSFGRVPLGERNRLVASSQAVQLRIESSRPMRVERTRLKSPKPLLDMLRTLGLPLPLDDMPVVLRPRAEIRIVVAPTPLVLVQVAAPRGQLITAVAYALGREVARTTRDGGDRSVLALTLEADRIDAVEIVGTGLRVVRVCIAIAEPCEDMSGWTPVIPCPLCLPVSHRSYGCKGRRPACDEEDARDRLPKDPCVRAQYQGANLDELLQTIRAVVDPARGLTMASRLPDLPASNEDCPPPGTDTPDVQVSALDALLMAAVDPVVARVLGLYHVDTSAVPGRRYDYKIVGVWPQGTLWSLENTITVDERGTDEMLAGAWTQDDVAFLLNRSARVVKVPTNFAGTVHALSVQPDVFDWASFFSGSSDAAPRLMVRFAQPVGEVQVYASHAGASLAMRAYRDGAEVAAVASTSPDSVLAAHAPGGIDMLIVEGELRMLFRIDWERDYIAHGRHCHVAYGLSAGPPTPLAAPDHVRGVALRGVTRKQSDCEPLGEGALADTRHLVGLRWLTPGPPDGVLLAREPIRFRIERSNPDATTVAVGGDDLVTVVPADDTVDVGAPLDWPDERQHVVDVVPRPGTYRYHVEGVDIFGRRSGFGPWSDGVYVQPIAPPPPSRVSGKWLDPADTQLTASERAWVEDGQAGLLVGWEWLDSQERQAPFVDAFQPLLERGWLNLVQGTAATDPVDIGAGAFRLDVQLDLGVPLAANALAGTTLSREGTAYRIRSSSATGSSAPYVSTLECAQPASGMPAWASGADVAIPLLPAVRATVEDVDVSLAGRTIRVLIGDLGAVPTGGFVGGAVLAGDQRWAIGTATGATVAVDGVRVSLQIGAGRGHLGMPFLFALLNQYVTIELPPPNPPYVDYRNAASWSASAGPVPSEGPGAYEVFIREVAGIEAPGRTTLAPRRHRILHATPLLDATPTAYGQVAIATLMAGTTGSASASASFVRVDRTPPATAAAIPADGAAIPGDIPSVYASLPDYGGRSSFHHRWPRANGMGYAVYRAFDETLFAVDRRVRGARSKVRAEWDTFLDQFPDPDGVVRDMAFALFVVQNDPPDYANLAPTNRLLQILASFPDVLEAFTRLNSELVAWDDPGFADRATEIPRPGEPAYVTQPNVRLYTDRTLPGQGTNAYFYRVGAVDALGNAGEVSTSTAPVWLRDLAAPAAPTVTKVLGGDRTIELRWAPVANADLAEYRVYRADTEANAAHLATMTLVGTRLPAAPPSELTVVDGGLVALTPYHYRIVALGANGQTSAPSPVVSATAYEASAPAPPVVDLVQRTGGGADLHLEWHTDYPQQCLVMRRLQDRAFTEVRSAWLDGVFDAATDEWTFAVDDTALDPAETYEYSIVGKTAAGHRTTSDVETV